MYGCIKELLMLKKKVKKLSSLVWMLVIGAELGSWEEKGHLDKVYVKIAKERFEAEAGFRQELVLKNLKRGQEVVLKAWKEKKDKARSKIEA